MANGATRQRPELKRAGSLFYLIRPAEGGMRGHLRSLVSHFGTACRTHLASPAGSGLEGLLTFPGSSFIKLPLEGELSLSRDLYSFWQVYRALLSSRPSLLHIHGFKSALIGQPAAGLAGVPSVITAHNFPAHRWRKALPAIIKAAQGGKTRYIAISRAIFQELSSWGIPPARITVIYNGIDPTPFEPAARGRRFRENPVVGTVARLAPQKGLPVFLKAACRLARTYPRLRFVIIGEGPQRLELEALTRRLGLHQRVSFLGFQDDLPGQLSLIDLFVQPSLTEGLSISLLEALAAKCPVVATRAGGIPEIIEDGVTGLLVPPGNDQALAEAISTLLAYPEQALVMAGAGREKVWRDFSLRAMLSRTAEVYREMGVKVFAPDE